ncbi:hypothetical protein [Calorimonas adulescens]|jgi:hypothetical protein|uniref:Uncharacterized protein n=1 Tax=Calorimonas adulescens TaxID=2606906 RepID=A0A5D8QDB8_9THEO|nr:hypothetical protein [Calorimonas adulescens]TZE82397.1 hypothetical protein FWJ32_05145 [Calorimonas adulescens]
MIKKVGFSRALKLEWLNSTVEIYENTKDLETTRKLVKEYLTYKIKGRVSLSKCTGMLMDTWVDVPDEYRSFINKGIELYDGSDSEQKIILHWGALMVAFPIFTDISSTIGRFLYLHDSFNASSVKKRIYELWGERSTVERVVRYSLVTMSDFGVISRDKKAGEYKRGKCIVVDNPEHKLFLINSYMLATNRKTLQYDTIEEQYPLFPFKMNLATHEINGSNVLTLNRFDNQTFVVMK